VVTTTTTRPNLAPAFTRGETQEALRERAWAVAARVTDPEIPVLTILDLGVLRDIKIGDGTVEVFITPTYCGCPAMQVIALNIESSLEEAGFGLARITSVLSPAWTTDWISAEGKAKLKRYGIAPPTDAGPRVARFGEESVTCPHCGATDTTRISEFGSTACKALWRCNACKEPFDYFKCI
jgi:ring-1,2-phenylacetyl-CoA epoxidase subunit PaaD